MAVAAAFRGIRPGIMAMRLVKPSPRQHALPEFAVAPIEPGRSSRCCSRSRYEEPLLLAEVVEEEALLLDDPLVEADPDRGSCNCSLRRSRRPASSRSGSTGTCDRRACTGP